MSIFLSLSTGKMNWGHFLIDKSFWINEWLFVTDSSTSRLLRPTSAAITIPYVSFFILFQPLFCNLFFYIIYIFITVCGLCRQYIPCEPTSLMSWNDIRISHSYIEESCSETEVPDDGIYQPLTLRNSPYGLPLSHIRSWGQNWNMKYKNFIDQVFLGPKL